MQQHGQKGCPATKTAGRGCGKTDLSAVMPKCPAMHSDVQLAAAQGTSEPLQAVQGSPAAATQETEGKGRTTPHLPRGAGAVAQGRLSDIAHHTLS